MPWHFLNFLPITCCQSFLMSCVPPSVSCLYPSGPFVSFRTFVGNSYFYAVRVSNLTRSHSLHFYRHWNIYCVTSDCDDKPSQQLLETVTRTDWLIVEIETGKCGVASKVMQKWLMNYNLNSEGAKTLNQHFTCSVSLISHLHLSWFICQHRLILTTWGKLNKQYLFCNDLYYFGRQWDISKHCSAEK